MRPTNTCPKFRCLEENPQAFVSGGDNRSCDERIITVHSFRVSRQDWSIYRPYPDRLPDCLGLPGRHLLIQHLAAGLADRSGCRDETSAVGLRKIYNLSSIVKNQFHWMHCRVKYWKISATPPTFEPEDFRFGLSLMGWTTFWWEILFIYIR